MKDNFNFGQFQLNPFGERYLYSVTGNTFAQTCSSDIYQKIYGRNIFQENQFHLIIGTDSGLLVHHILKHNNKNCRYLFVDFAPVIDLIRRQVPSFPIHKNIDLCIIDDWHNTAKKLDLERYALTNSVQFTHSIASKEAHLSDYIPLASQLTQDAHRVVQKIRTILQEKFFIDQMLLNIPDNIQPSLFIKNIFCGHSCVILGGGPSLDDYIDWIKKNRKNIVVIAAPRMCKRLLEVDLVPDIFVSIDPTQKSFDNSKEILKFNDILLINGNHVNHMLLGQYNGKTAFLGTKYPWFTPANQKNFDICAPTVINTAIHTAIIMGFKQIILCGVDLCFSPEGYTHAKGSNEYKAGPLITNNNLVVTTNDGRQAETSRYFVNAIKPMENLAKQAKASGHTVINPTGYATQLADVDYIPIQNIQLTSIEQMMAQTIHDAIPTLSAQDRINIRQASMTELEKLHAQLNKIKKLTHQALKFLAKIKQTDNHQTLSYLNVQLDIINETFKTTYHDATSFVRAYAANEFMSIVSPSPDKLPSHEEAMKASQAYYKTYKKTIRIILHRVEDCIDKTQTRIIEDQDNPDFQRLTRRWTKDQHFGRAHLWKNQHAASYANLDQTSQCYLQGMNEKFSALLNKKSTHRQYQADDTGLKGIGNKAKQYFIQKNIQGLNDLLLKIQEFKNIDTHQYRAITQAYLWDIQGEIDQALPLYLDISLENIIEEALSRATTIYLIKQQTPEALKLLDRLCTLTQAFMPIYAELLNKAGNNQTAIGIYTDYLQNNPEDFPTFMQLGKLYYSVGIFDSAQWVFDYILKNQPNNLEAQAFMNYLKNSA